MEVNFKFCLAEPLPEIPRRYMIIISRFVRNDDFQIIQLTGIHKNPYFPGKVDEAKTKLCFGAVLERWTVMPIFFFGA